MARVPRWIVPILCATLILAVACTHQQWTPATVQSFLAQELPPGANKQSVVQFFRARNIECENSQQGLRAVFRNKSGSGGSGARDIAVTFQFDANGKLAANQVEELP